MKTKLFATIIAAMAVMASFFPSQSLAQYQVTTPTWEQVGMSYGNFVQTLYGGGGSYYGVGGFGRGFFGSKSVEGLEDIMFQSLAETYGPNVGYFYYFSALAQNYYSDASLYVALGISYAEYLVHYYAYLYYLSPDYVNQLADYFYNYIYTQENSFYDFLYDDNLFNYYQDVAYYYYGLVFPQTVQYTGSTGTTIYTGSTGTLAINGSTGALTINGTAILTGGTGSTITTNGLVPSQTDD